MKITIEPKDLDEWREWTTVPADTTVYVNHPLIHIADVDSSDLARRIADRLSAWGGA